MPHELLMENAIDKRGCVNHEAGVEFAMWAVRPHGWKLSFLLEARRRGVRRRRCSNNCWCFTHATALENLRHANQSDSRLLHHLLLLFLLFFSCLSIVCQSVIRSIIIDYSIVLNFLRFFLFINIATKKFISVDSKQIVRLLHVVVLASIIAFVIIRFTFCTIARVLLRKSYRF